VAKSGVYKARQGGIPKPALLCRDYSKKSKQKARAKRPMRIAKVSVRYLQVKLNPPPYHNDKDPIAIWVVHVREDNQPVNTDRHEWFLLTTINIKSIDDAFNCVE